MTKTLDEPLAPHVAVDVGHVVAAHGEYLWATLQRLGVPPSDLSDALQDVLIVVHRRRDDYDGRTRLQAWLYGICVRVTMARRRRAHVRHEQAVAELPVGLDVASGPDPERLLVEQQERARLAAILDEMEPERRAVFVMYEIEELSCAQIAALIGVPLGTVHSRLHAARKELQKVAARMERQSTAGRRGAR